MKKGFTLIELIVGLAIQAIVMGVGIKGVVIAIERYEIYKTIEKEENKIDEALMTINRYLNSNMIENIKINDISNEISVKIRDGHSTNFYLTKKIKLDKERRVVLESYNNNNYKSAVNVVLRDTEKFDLIKKENVYYLRIKTLKGEERVVCL